VTAVLIDPTVAARLWPPPLTTLVVITGPVRAR
jgi:hypothetical protein